MLQSDVLFGMNPFKSFPRALFTEGTEPFAQILTHFLTESDLQLESFVDMRYSVSYNSLGALDEQKR